MRELTTPWRLRYILSNKDQSGCIFCRKPADRSKSSLILHRGTGCYVIMNLYPYTAGHLMVVPYRHIARHAALTLGERSEMALLLRRAERALRDELGATEVAMGINLERIAGAGVVGHLHAHLVPLAVATPAVDAGGHDPGWEEPALPEPVGDTFKRLRASFARPA
ncbi:MAG: HIT domain-containing protein [Candidatus Eisenbacteria bacterium]|nr:HIT domain-containing protein [Candidatus Eisenbacteria bacterium]MCC7143057.1 HIT domain-containing protein [Candidatus Eisenbacteria bacterium]